MHTLLPADQRGHLIVVYAPNNLGKTTQIRLLKQRCDNELIPTIQLKFPIYDLPPTGPLINLILRQPEALDRAYSALELQQIYAQNRFDFQPHLIEILNSGTHVIAEDYVGTGIAWGMTEGVSQVTLEAINTGLVLPDQTILLDGERFGTGIETSHLFEQKGNETWLRNREIYRMLACKSGWEVMAIEQSESTHHIHERLWELVSPSLCGAIEG